MYSLRKLVWMTFTAAAILLAVVIMFGIYQYVLAGRYNDIISQNERALFRFATIRESVTGALIERDPLKLEKAIPEIEELNSALARLEENPLVPPEFKFALADKVDMAGLAITIRRIVNGDTVDALSVNLLEDIRVIADHLVRYDRIIVGQARSRMLDFQMIIIGSMGIILSLASFSLILLYRNSVMPLLNISEQLQEADIGELELDPAVGASREVAQLLETIQANCARADLSANLVEGAQKEAKLALIAETVNETTNQLNGIINYAQIIADNEDGDMTEGEKELLSKIISAGTTIARTWQKIQWEGNGGGYYSDSAADEPGRE